MAKWVYLFKEGNAQMRNLLGGKGANLAEMTGLGLPVPQGFTITTEACTQYYEDGQEINDVLDYQFYVDFEASPMIMKACSSTDHAFFEQAFENLLHDFEDILESQENSER